MIEFSRIVFSTTYLILSYMNEIIVFSENMLQNLGNVVRHEEDDYN